MAQDSTAFPEAFGEALENLAPGIGKPLENAELKDAISRSVQQILEHVPADKRTAQLGNNLGRIYGDTIRAKILDDLSKAKTEPTAEIVLGKINDALTHAEEKAAKHVLGNVSIKDEAKCQGLKGIAKATEEEFKTLTGRAKSFLRPVRGFFGKPEGGIYKVRASAFAAAGIGLAGGTLYLLTRQEETPEQSRDWTNRVTAHAEQQGATVQR